MFLCIYLFIVKLIIILDGDDQQGKRRRDRAVFRLTRMSLPSSQSVYLAIRCAKIDFSKIFFFVFFIIIIDNFVFTLVDEAHRARREAPRQSRKRSAAQVEEARHVRLEQV